MDPVRESSVFFSSFCPSQVSFLQGRMAPELLLGGCYWPQSSGQSQAAKTLAALRFQLVLPQGLLCRGQSQAPWVSVVCVDGAHESPHLSRMGRAGTPPSSLPWLFTVPGILLQVGPASSHGCYLGMSLPLPSLAILIPVLPLASSEDRPLECKSKFPSPTTSKKGRECEGPTQLRACGASKAQGRVLLTGSCTTKPHLALRILSKRRGTG